RPPVRIPTCRAPRPRAPPANRRRPAPNPARLRAPAAPRPARRRGPAARPAPAPVRRARRRAPVRRRPAPPPPAANASEARPPRLGSRRPPFLRQITSLADNSASLRRGEPSPSRGIGRWGEREVGEMNARIMAALGGSLALGLACGARAGVYSDNLAGCLAHAATAQDQADLSRWLFAEMAQNPALKGLTAVGPPERKALQRAAALDVQRLVLSDCRKEAVAAVRYDGRPAL